MAYDNGNIIELKKICLSIGNRQIINNIDIEIQRNKITMILGKSGSGKSSLLNILNLLYIPDSGIYEFNGKVIDSKDELTISEMRKKIGFFHQELALIEELTVKENMEIFSGICEKAIDEIMLNEYLKLLELDKIYETNISLLSGGERQRAAFLKLLIIPYEIVFIDEPTNNLDTGNIEVIIKGIKKLKEQNKTVVVVSHYMPLQDIADFVIKLEEINE